MYSNQRVLTSNHVAVIIYFWPGWTSFWALSNPM
jgi:hypothetical protein